MQSNPHLVFGLVLIAVALFGGIPFISMKTARVKKFGLVAMLVGVFVGLTFTIAGALEKDSASRPVHTELSKGARAVQKLLRGEEVLPDYYLPLDTAALTSIAEFKLKLSPDTLAKLRDQRRWTIRFNTNDTLQMVTNH